METLSRIANALGWIYSFLTGLWLGPIGFAVAATPGATETLAGRYGSRAAVFAGAVVATCLWIAFGIAILVAVYGSVHP